MTDDILDIAVGDWVRFYQGSVLVIGVVQYVRETDSAPHVTEARTDVGAILVTSVVERRRPTKDVPRDLDDPPPTDAETSSSSV